MLPIPIVSVVPHFVKWLLAIPHWIVLSVLTFGHVPGDTHCLDLHSDYRPLPARNVGFLIRRHALDRDVYAYLFLQRDEYPPFSMDSGEYPVTFEMEYPHHLSRLLIFVKWLLIIPSLIVFAFVIIIWVRFTSWPGSRSSSPATTRAVDRTFDRVLRLGIPAQSLSSALDQKYPPLPPQPIAVAPTPDKHQITNQTPHRSPRPPCRGSAAGPPVFGPTTTRPKRQPSSRLTPILQPSDASGSCIRAPDRGLRPPGVWNHRTYYFGSHWGNRAGMDVRRPVELPPPLAEPTKTNRPLRPTPTPPLPSTHQLLSTTGYAPPATRSLIAWKPTTRGVACPLNEGMSTCSRKRGA